MEKLTEKQKKMQELALEILKLSRNSLLVNLRFLDEALHRLQLEPVDRSTFLTDGETLFFCPGHVLECYRREQEIPVRDLMHVVLHCVFRHMWMDPSLNRPYWDLACDIAVENVIRELEIADAAASRGAQQAPYLDLIQKEIEHPTAEKIYRYLRRTKPDEARVADLRGWFYADNHAIWYMTASEARSYLGLPPGSAAPNSGPAEVQQTSAGTRDAWERLSRQIETNLETIAKQRGNQAGSLVQSLRELNRETCDYTTFLQKFAVYREEMKLDPDTFDYAFYSYGMSLYHNMPLIEPLEYQEQKKIRDFVIAIDTSGSTSGDLVQRFVEKTYNILKSSECFFSRINVHILQCDAKIQEDVRITSQEEFDEYLRNMKLRGGGGTDFRPVFEYVRRLQEAGELTELRGLIYLTDGCGVYPAKAPDYETAFVFVEDSWNDYDVPAWAMKLILTKEELEQQLR